MSTNGVASAPSLATDAVLKPSAPVSEDAQRVRGIDFNNYAGRDVTVAEMISGMANMGFQATAVADAVRIINEMVSALFRWQFFSHLASYI
jgi:deoxyhypusine synthase